MDEQPTTEKLATALEAANAPALMVERARAGYYDDYKSELPAPIMQLVADCRAAGLTDIEQRAIGGDFDASQAEGEAWFKAEGSPMLMADIRRNRTKGTKKKRSPRPQGFGGKAGLQPTPDDSILIGSYIDPNNTAPAVVVKWGDRIVYFTPQEARDNAFAILKEAATVQLDACLMRWVQESLGRSPGEAVQFVEAIRRKRETEPVPSCTMNLGTESIRPDTARERGMLLLNNAFGIEVEAVLMLFMMQDLELSIETSDQLLQDFRAMRGAVTMWPNEAEGGDRDG